MTPPAEGSRCCGNGSPKEKMMQTGADKARRLAHALMHEAAARSDCALLVALREI
jgi:hypothetical protein